MIDVDVCPLCDSSNTQLVEAREDDDYKYVEMHCNVYIKRENVGYVVDVWVGDTLVNTMALWDDCIDSIMEDEKC